MANYKGHLIGGAVAYGIFLLVGQLHNISFYTALEWLLFSLAGALFPDIDTKSKGQKLFYWFLLFFFFFAILKENFSVCAILGIIAIIPMLVRHRGLFHSLWFITVISSLIVFFGGIYFPCYKYILFFDMSFFFVGALSHILLDFGFKHFLR